MWHQFTVLGVLFKECKTRRDHLGYQYKALTIAGNRERNIAGAERPREGLCFFGGGVVGFFFHLLSPAKVNKDKALPKTLNQSKNIFLIKKKVNLFQVLLWPRRKAKA